MAAEALRVDRAAKGVYFTLNPLLPDILSRRASRIERAKDGEQASDVHVARRKWLPIDCDPKRIAGVAATEEEKAAAWEVAGKVINYLAGEDWPDPILADSGNGYHLLYRIDLPRDDDSLVKRCLEALAAMFDTPQVSIDRKVFNPARIMKLYGTLARKGDDTKQRPHRRSKIISVPDDLAERGPVPREKLEILAAEAPEPEKPAAGANGAHANGTTNGSANGQASGQYTSRLLVGKWLTDRGVKYRVKPLPDNQGRTVYVLEKCPFDPTHGDPDSSIMQGLDGKLSANCFHNSCNGRGWQAFKEAIGKPGAEHYDPPLTGRQRSADQASGENGQQAQAPAPGFCWAPIDSATFAKGDYKPQWLVKRMLVRGQPAVMGGPAKSMKTSVLVGLAISLGTGTPFLGAFDVYGKFRVVMVSGESGEHVLQETALRVCAAKGVDLASVDCLWMFRLPQLGAAEDLTELGRGLKESGAEIVLLDPLYLSLLAGAGGDGKDAANLFDIGPLLMDAARACLDAGATPLLCHHTTKPVSRSHEPLELWDLAFSGIAEFARQWILINRREPYEAGSGRHRLWLVVGGSCGQGGHWALNADEGRLLDDFTGRIWDVTVTPAGEARAAEAAGRGERREQAKAEQARRDGSKLLAVLDRLDPERKGAGYTKVRDTAGLSGARMILAVDALVLEGILEEVSIPCPVGNGGTRPGRGIRRVSR